jgi:hypothetical protein
MKRITKTVRTMTAPIIWCRCCFAKEDLNEPEGCDAGALPSMRGNRMAQMLAWNLRCGTGLPRKGKGLSLAMLLGGVRDRVAGGRERRHPEGH